MCEWIRVEDRLPEESQLVLYYFEPVGIHVGRYNKEVDDEGYEYNVFHGRSGFLTDDVTHWMPFPDAPK